MLSEQMDQRSTECSHYADFEHEDIGVSQHYQVILSESINCTVVLAELDCIGHVDQNNSNPDGEWRDL